MSGGEYAALAYVVVFVVVLVYVAIIAAKLQRLQREISELADLASRERRGGGPDRSAVYAAAVPRTGDLEGEST